jgi:hypothetical protein
MQGKSKSGERSVVISLKDEERKYLSGHVIDGRNLFPAMGYLVSCRMNYHTNVVIGFAYTDVTLFIFTSHIEKGLQICNYFETVLFGYFVICCCQ